MTAVQESAQDGADQRLSLATEAARPLTTTTKTPPQMQEITSRWLLRALPWVEVKGGAYRVNRRLSFQIGDGRLSFTIQAGEAELIPDELRELPALRDFDDAEVLEELAERFTQQQFAPGDVIAEFGNPTDQVFVVAHGKLTRIGNGPYGDQVVLGTLADGEYFGADAITDPDRIWEATFKAATRCTVMSIPRTEFDRIAERSQALRRQIERYRATRDRPTNRYGEAPIDLAAGHVGEPDLPGTFVAYEQEPREYELSVAQTVLRVHTRVADLFNDPMNQTAEQLRLTVEALKERQDKELVNNKEFGLLHNADLRQRISTRTGPPTPDDLDELLSLRRGTNLILAHPKALVAIGRECNRRGLYPTGTEFDGQTVGAWRGVPLLPCSKIPVTDQTTSILAMRLGEQNQGVVGLRQTGLPDEYEPGLNVRFMGISDKGILSYLVSTYYSVAVLVPDALGILENCELGHFYD